MDTNDECANFFKKIMFRFQTAREEVANVDGQTYREI